MNPASGVIVNPPLLSLEQSPENYARTAWWARYRGRKDGEDCECLNCVDRRDRYGAHVVPKEI